MYFPGKSGVFELKRGFDNFQSAKYAVIHCAFCPKLIQNQWFIHFCAKPVIY
jgi:hypothetical protein